MRLFFAVPVTDAASAALSALCARLQTQRGWRWVPQHNWHVTTAFIGSADSSLLPALTELGHRAAANHARSALLLDRFEWWPTARRPHLLVAAGDATEALIEMNAQLVEGCAQLGLEIDARPLRPHLTLVRLQRDTEPVQPALPDCAVEVPVERLVLYSSERGGHGSIYREVWQHSLA